MVARVPGRPKASDLSDYEALRACEQWTDKGLPHPLDSFPELPRKVVIARMHKVIKRGWIDGKWHLTKLGRSVLLEMDEAVSA